MLRHLKSLPITIVLTILIWMYAEAEFRDHWQSPAIPIVVSDPAGLRSRYTMDMLPAEVSVKVTGARDAINKLREAMMPGSQSPQEEQIRIYLDLTSEDKPTTRPVARQLRYKLPEGLSLESEPGKVSFKLTEAGAASRP